MWEIVTFVARVAIKLTSSATRNDTTSSSTDPLLTSNSSEKGIILIPPPAAAAAAVDAPQGLGCEERTLEKVDDFASNSILIFG